MKTKFTKGQSVMYDDMLCVIESVESSGVYVISNPSWSWELEAECVEMSLVYDVPYFLRVKESELTAIK